MYHFTLFSPELFAHAQNLFSSSPISDVISGAIMAATSVPQLIAYAELVGYAGYRGLSTAGAPLLAWGVATGKCAACDMYELMPMQY